MYSFFLYILIVILVITMVNYTRKRMILKSNRKLRSRQLRNKKKELKLKKVAHFIERFGLLGNDLEMEDDEIRKCNEVLVAKENDCNCFKDADKEFPKEGIYTCLHKKKTSPYCKNYNKCKKNFARLLTGSEQSYNPDKWSNPIIEGSHNCYAYFLDDHIPELKHKCTKLCKEKGNCSKKINECSNLKPQPGDYAHKMGILDKKDRTYKCPAMVRKVLLDNMDKHTNQNLIHKTKFESKCPPNYYKGAVVVDPDHTYHFYRQDKNVRYSHKQGTLRVENLDASKKPIYAPHLADRNYNKKKKKNGINYTDFCTYLCVPNNEFLETHAI